MKTPLPARWIEQPVRIALIGAGGTGSQLADALASLQATLMALGHPGFTVTVYDHDTVSRSNLGRQRFTASDIGHNKAILLTHRINAFYGVNWRAKPEAFAPNATRGYDLLLTCTDKATFRAQLAANASEATYATPIFWLDCGNAADTGQVVLGQLNGPRTAESLPHVVHLFPEQFTREAAAAADADDTPSCGTAEAIARQQWPVNRIAAQAAAELLWSWFRHGQISHHGVQFQLNPLRTQPIPIDPSVWACFGYDVRPEPMPSTAKTKSTTRKAA